MVERYRKHFQSDDLKPTPFLCLLEVHIFPNSGVSCKKNQSVLSGNAYNFDHLKIIPYASATAILKRMRPDRLTHDRYIPNFL